jgi:hypothetical protein
VPAWRAWLLEFERIAPALAGLAAARTTLRPPRNGEDLEAFSVAAYTSGLGPLIGLRIEQGSFSAPADLADTAALHLLHGRRRAEVLRATRDEAVALLSRAEVPVTLLKGAHTSAVYFPEPGTRPAADVDLLVPSRSLATAGAAFAAAGWTPGTSQRRPAKHDWIPPGSPRLPRSLHLAHADDPRSVELHGSLARDFFGVATVDIGYGDRSLEAAPEIDPRVRVLRPTPLAAFLALHASQEVHHLQMVRLLELALVLRTEADRQRLETDRLADLLRAAAGLAFALPALDLTEKLIPGTVDHGLLEEARAIAPVRMLRRLDRLRPAAAQRIEGVTVADRLMWASGTRQTVRRVLDLLVPSRARGSARPPLETYGDRLFGLLRGRIRFGSAAGEDPAP